ncbi:unnamed protein product [Lactuca saligna]|uniref:Uncharacterized protein n=1 Tax=Lactuca saligna TaxID=75948 RepID=A0AA35Z1D5_LACSI|nr:unnamed protein product [Lactuca saligna]
MQKEIENDERVNAGNNRLPAIATLNQLPPLVVFGRTVFIFPLLFILTVTAIKDGYEDWRRHISDRNENNKESLVIIPCDMVLMWTSDPSGIAYIQTMNLDGESNLKTRYARQETSLMPLGSISGVKNTKWVIGVVVYVGQETKAMLNSAISPSKRSRLEQAMNSETIWLSVFLFILCLVVAIRMCLWLMSHQDAIDTIPYYRNSYLIKGKFPEKSYKYYGIPMETFFAFLSSVIVFQIMIPISLYITMELVRLG